MTTTSMYTPVGWGRRPPGNNTTYRDTLRHLRDPNRAGDPRTLCGFHIPPRALQEPAGRGMFAATVIGMTAREVEQAAPCHRCYARAGLELHAAPERTEAGTPEPAALPYGQED